MTHEQIAQKVFELTSEELEIEISELTEATEFKALGADSFDLLNLVTAFEDEFSCGMDEDVLEGITTIGDAVSALEKALA